MPRLGHKKSRNGCQQCKTRHVKCDESKPCANCARHGVQCSLVTWDPDAPAPTSIKREASADRSASKITKSIPERPRKPSIQASGPASSHIDYVLNPSPAPTPTNSEGGSPYSQADTYPFLTKFVNQRDVIQSNYWVRDLELMHHWTTEAHSVLSSQDEIKHMWRVIAPKQAVKHHYLMHEILAHSALNMAYLYPSDRKAFYAIGIHHQDIAIREMRNMLASLSSDNAGPVFATSALITLSVFGSTGMDANDSATDSRPLLDDLLDIFALQQGIWSILSSGARYVLEGPFASLLTSNNDNEPPLLILQELSTQLPKLTSSIDSQSLPLEIRHEILESLVSLQGCIDYAMAPVSTSRALRFLFFWPIRINHNFLLLLRSKDSAALAVLAHYAVAFRAAESIYWFMDGWAERVVRAIAEAVGPSWRHFIQWPWDTVVGEAQRHETQERSEA